MKKEKTPSNGASFADILHGRGISAFFNFKKAEFGRPAFRAWSIPHSVRTPRSWECYNFQLQKSRVWPPGLPGMETAGVEPASENRFMQLSPGADRLLCFPPASPADRVCRSVALSCVTDARANSPFTDATHFMPWSNKDALPVGTLRGRGSPRTDSCLS